MDVYGQLEKKKKLLVVSIKRIKAKVTGLLIQ